MCIVVVFVSIVVSCLVCIAVSRLVCIVVVVLCIVVILCVFAVLCVLLFFTLDAGLLARSQYSEGPVTGHLDTGFFLVSLRL